MNTVPIVFAFDNNIIMPACICISSLLMSANENTYYDIFILHSNNIDLKKDDLEKIPMHYPNCRIQFLPVGNSFESGYEIRGVTKATYYRLLIPNIIKQYDKVIYSDVDIIFRMDLSELYNSDIADNYVAATLDVGLNQDAKHLQSIGVKQWQYLQAGFIIMNLKQMRIDNMVERFIELGKNNYKYQDQDILNISCKDRIMFIEPCYNVNDCALIYMYWHPDQLPDFYSESNCLKARQNGNIHYSGYKPWKRYSIAFDVWWEFYRKSPFFDEKYYFKFFFDKTMVLDSLTLWKRIKILSRFFVYGRYKG